MTKMSEAQRIAIVDFHNGVTSKRHTMVLKSSSTADVMVREGWAARVDGMARRLVHVTTAGLIAAGIDMDAIHAEAHRENDARDVAADLSGISTADETPRPGPRTMALRQRSCVRTDGSHANHAAPVDGMNCDPDHPTAEDERVTAAQREAFGSPAPAPTLADDVAALRSMIERCNDDEDVSQTGMLAVLDRIAARVPQRATAYGLELWQHACGAVDHAGPEQPHPDQCDNCRQFRPLTSDPWHALYVLPDGA